MTEHTHKDYSKLYVPAAIVIAGIIIGICVIVALRPTAGAQPSGGQPTVAVNIKDVKIADEPFIGAANAPVVLAFWSDFQCPYCKAVETGGIPQITIKPAIPDLIKNYVDTGKVKIVFKDFPFLGEDSITAAEYARAVWDLYPEQYFAFRTALYTAQDDEGDNGFGDAASIDALIKKELPQIDLAKVKSALTTNKAKYDAALEANKAEAATFGINGTPGFITGKVMIPGAVEFAQFKAAIDPQL